MRTGLKSPDKLFVYKQCKGWNMKKTDTLKGITKQAFVHCVWAEHIDIDANIAKPHGQHASHAPQVMDVNSTLTRVFSAISNGLSLH